MMVRALVVSWVLFFALEARAVKPDVLCRGVLPYSSFFNQLVRLEKTAWEAYVDQLGRDGERGFKVNELRLPLAVMPESLKATLKAKAGQRRSEVASAPELTDEVSDFLPPKRALDCLLAHLFDPRGRFETAQRLGAKPAVIYEMYLRDTQKALGRREEKNGYGADQVIRVAKAWQRTLIEAPNRPAAHEPTLVMVGSFPNGKADLKRSDLDVVVIPPETASLIPKLNVAAHRELPSDSTLEIGPGGVVEEFVPGTAERYFALRSPVNVVITAKKIQVTAYAAGISFAPAENEAPPVILDIP